MSNKTKKEVVRFAPSPTGDLHIGSVRTAYFNWLFAKANNGTFKLRIEDTDKVRSKKELTQSIIDQLSLLGLTPDCKVVYQSNNIIRHVEVANELLNLGLAYKCFASQEELQQMKEQALKNKSKLPFYNKKWRDIDPAKYPDDKSFVVRLKVDIDGTTQINDQIQGKVVVENKTIEDFVILRSDQSPTYNFSVVVDDHDMNITTVLRGDDHLTNTFKQYQVYKALGWDFPKFGHFPLIHNEQGKKLSKRKDNTSLNFYLSEKGYLPETILNYCLRLGFGYKDLEIINKHQAIKIFNLSGIGRSPSKFDNKKLNSLSLHYMKKMIDENTDQLTTKTLSFLSKRIKKSNDFKVGLQRFTKGISGLVARSKNLSDVASLGEFYFETPNHLKNTSDIMLTNNLSKDESYKASDTILDLLETTKNNFSGHDFFNLLKDRAKREGIKFHIFGKTLRLALTGNVDSPSLTEVMDILGYDEIILRLKSFRDFLTAK